MKKTLAVLIIAALALSILAGCGGSTGSQSNNSANNTAGQSDNSANNTAGQSESSANPASDWNESRTISVVSREDGSGTRGAFIELFGIQVRDDTGGSRDLTTREATIADGTNIMMTNIASDPYAIGYISLGSLNDTIKALNIDGVQASVENIKNGSYEIQRPFNVAWLGEAEGLQEDFINFIFSKEGQDVVADRGYIVVDDNAPAYSGERLSGRLVINGSSSVYPLMERIVEAYQAVNSNASIELHQTDSSAGMTAAMNGSCDIGMASRDLRDSEKEALSHTAIAIDGIAVIVNNENPRANLTSEQINSIFTGETTEWSSAK